jgi:protein-S-isoprenylcysteine O-methyltransferase Ste14
VGFVVFGLVAILVGVALGWKWVRNFWFRIIHFLMIAVVAAEAMGGVLCPLTTWEDDLRAKAGMPIHEGSFIGRICEKVLFVVDPDWVRVAHCMFGAVVLATLILAPPRRPQGPRWLVGPRKSGG